ncbi:GspH/FimT family pseudopilin [Roseateles asaccharophilus]|uniref:Type II secretion system protein H n=1 Tax=Roseateles asaccharophilus TaxID=582607 RepID=A0ABU2A5W5_9BURK|nr:GspH/FimT family pseudopilin [Roseateles asaccharophilus]MDR7332530.1 Tfp pilus assembly protein FimT [Roseateles asaccharophilus]
MKRTATTARRHSLGFTLVELCVGMGVCAAVVGQAVPAFSRMHHEQALRANAEALGSDLRLARSEAVRTADPVFFRISAKGGNNCYIIHTGAKDACDCAGGLPVCKTADSSVVKAVWLPQGLPMTLRSNAETLQFQHRQGLVTQTGSIELALKGGAAVRQVVAITGRVRSCAVGAKMAGLSRCA